MKIAHVGPPLARQGGPGGYLLQLQRAAGRAGALDAILFPSPAPASSRAPIPAATRIRRALSATKRALGFRPRFYRPSDRDLADPAYVDGMLRAANAQVVADAAPSLAAGVDRADVLFCHEPAAAERALAVRRPGQAVWLMAHCPVPLALYLVWSWGVPEKDWREIAAAPAIQRWIAWELDIWRRVDRLAIPCAEALHDFARVAPAARTFAPTITYLLSGSSLGAADRSPDRRAARRKFGLPPDVHVALFLGSNQPYRGLDALLAGIRAVPADAPAGLVAVAGPARSDLPRHSRLRALGPVGDVPALLRAVDTVVNVNRFSLFDLSTIEAVEAGKPLLMHAVGGNLTFAALGAGCEMLPNLDPATIAAGLARMFAKTHDDIAALGDASRRCFERHLTLDLFWQRHAALYARASAGALHAV
jgi:glycosyltransferase involved in cell wall biosynthesis